jgi:hypothetical protein
MAELLSVGNAVQSSEMMCNSLGLNYKISCSNQLSYASAVHMKAGLASSSRVRPTISMHDE